MGVCERCDSKGDREQGGWQVCMLEGFKVRIAAGECGGERPTIRLATKRNFIAHKRRGRWRRVLSAPFEDQNKQVDRIGLQVLRYGQLEFTAGKWKGKGAARRGPPVRWGAC